MLEVNTPATAGSPGPAPSCGASLKREALKAETTSPKTLNHFILIQVGGGWNCKKLWGVLVLLKDSSDGSDGPALSRMD